LTFEIDVTAAGNLTLESAWRNTSAPTNEVMSHGALISAGSDMSISAAGTLYLYSNPTNGGSALLQMDNFQIAAGGMVNADGGGFEGAINMDGYGPGGGGRDNTYGGGGGFGGKGGVGRTLETPYGAAGATNGQDFAVLWPGSGGGGRSIEPGDEGGGLVRIEALGTATVDGTISANGNSKQIYAGSGSGGGIFIQATTFEGAGTGVLQANGGVSRMSWAGSGAGGGGRIVIWYGQIDEVTASKILDGEYADLRQRFIATTSIPTFAGTTAVEKGTKTNVVEDQGQEDGTVYFITVLPPGGTLILIN